MKRILAIGLFVALLVTFSGVANAGDKYYTDTPQNMDAVRLANKWFLTQAEKLEYIEACLRATNQWIPRGKETAQKLVPNPKAKPELSEQIAHIYIKAINLNYADVHRRSGQMEDRLKMAAHYAVKPETRDTILTMWKNWANKASTPRAQNIRLEEAAKVFGHAAVYGFEIVEMSPNKFKVVFLTSEPIDTGRIVKAQKKFQFSAAKHVVKLYDTDGFYPMPMNRPISMRVDKKLILLGTQGDSVIVELL